MLAGVLAEEMKTLKEEKRVRKKLDNMFDEVRTIKQLNELRHLIDDYLDEGYKIKSYVFKYNKLAQNICYGE